MAWRVGLASLAFGFGFGRYNIGFDPVPPPVAIGAAAATTLFALFLANEYRHFYSKSDELVRRTLVASLAVAGLLLMAASGLYGVFELLLLAPPIPMILVFLFAVIVNSVAWMVAGWKTS
jgi:putative flippase GtrA